MTAGNEQHDARSTKPKVAQPQRVLAVPVTGADRRPRLELLFDLEPESF